MRSIPAHPEVATKSGIESPGVSLGDRTGGLHAHMSRLDDELDGFHQALRDQTRTSMFTMTGA